MKVLQQSAVRILIRTAEHPGMEFPLFHARKFKSQMIRIKSKLEERCRTSQKSACAQSPSVTRFWTPYRVRYLEIM